MKEPAPTEKGAGVSASPPCRRIFGLAPATGGCARLHVGGMLGPRRQGKRASRPGQRSADASRWPSPSGEPPEGYPPAASRVVGCPSGGKPPWGRSPGRGRSRRISFPPRCPLLCLCHAASASRFRSSRVDGPEGSSCLDGLARFTPPEGIASRAFGYPAWLVPKHAPALITRSTLARRHRLRVLVAWLVHAPGEHVPPWRPVLPMPKHVRDVSDTRSVSFPSHPLSRAGQAVSRGGVPVPIRAFPEGRCAFRSVVNF